MSHTPCMSKQAGLALTLILPFPRPSQPCKARRSPASAPVLPVRPLEPVRPLRPVSPVLPVRPEEPVEPLRPDCPVAPVKPDAPELPLLPVSPVLPAGETQLVTRHGMWNQHVSHTPCMSKQAGLALTLILPFPRPSQPCIARPVRHSAPVLPVRPLEPVRPLRPVSPVLPVRPEDPVEPLRPDCPVAPVKPDAPELPLLPVSPVLPAWRDTACDTPWHVESACVSHALHEQASWSCFDSHSAIPKTLTTM